MPDLQRSTYGFENDTSSDESGKEFTERRPSTLKYRARTMVYWSEYVREVLQETPADR